MDNKFISKSERKIKILDKLDKSNEIIRKTDLASIFCVSERTIIRDIKSLRNENYTILIISGRNGGYRKMKGNDGN